MLSLSKHEGRGDERAFYGAALRGCRAVNDGGSLHAR